MSNYTKSTNFATKDNLTPGDPLKVVRGTEIDTEFNNIATAVATKTDNASAAITGGTITGITDLAVADGGTGASTAAGALNNLLPSQTSAANKYLQSDGTNASWDAVTLSTADITGTLPVANGGTGVTASTGTGSVVLSNSPTLVTPALGTPASGVATNITGLPISTGVSGLGTGVATFLGTPSSANLISAVTDETGTGSLVFATSPTLVTPALGTPSALVGTNITGTASGLTAGNVTTNANLTGAVTSVGNATSLGSFSSANLLGALTDETGTGSAVFATSPTLVTPILGTPTSATLTNATGLPIATGVSGLGTGVATFLATPSSANLAAALTDETGSGANVFATSPTLVTPILGTPTSATLTNATGLPISTGVSGLGTGIATALAVNTGSAGAPVLFNGALGTPSSGTVTNLTGTASININGTVGATTATTGAFTTVSATGQIATDTSFSPRSSGTSAGVFASGLQIGGSGNDLVIYGQKAGGILLYPNATLVANFASTGLAITGTLSASGVSTLTGGAQVTGSVSGYGGGEVLLGPTTSGAQSAISTQATGTPTIAFDHRGTSNTGTFLWRNGTSAASELMRLTSTGLGIGTSSPAQKLDVSGGNARISSGSSTADLLMVDTGTTSGNVRLRSETNAMKFITGGGVSATLDSAGNLGLGVTPSAWGGNYKAIQVGSVGSLANYLAVAVSVGNNFYDSGAGAYTYITSNYATRYRQQSGTHAWEISASGTAGNAITFTQAMTLDASGNLLVGITSGASGLISAGPVASKTGIFGSANTATYAGIQGAHTVNSATGYVAYFANSGSTTGLYISNTAAWQSTSDARLKTDVKDLDSTARLMALRPVDYLWKSQETSDDPTKRNLGFIAQEVKEVFPELVGVSPDGMFSVEYTGLIAPLVKAIQELKTEFDAYKASHP